MCVFEYYDTDTNATVYYVIPSLESNDNGSGIESESESRLSSTTLESDDIPVYYVKHHGRQLPASDSFAKWLPPDNIRRHLVRYVVSRALFGGNYGGPVPEILASTEGTPRRVLEIGTRAGTWVQSVASEFPHIQFLSLDAVPVIPHTPRPNIAFEVYDFASGLLLEDESQDIVFMNFVTEMVKDFPSLLGEVHRVLRPGGMLHIHDFCPDLWDSEVPSKPARHRIPIAYRLIDRLQEEGCRAVGVEINTFSKLPGWLLPDSGLWDQSNNNRGGFERIQTEVRAFPCYPHDGFPCVAQLGNRLVPYARYLVTATFQDLFGVLRDGGIGSDEAEKLIEEALQELRQPENCVLAKHYRLYAFRR